MCLCLCARFACTPPLLAGVCVVGVCACARVSAAPRHSSLGCWWVSLFVCALRPYPATPGWRVRCVCVCLGSDFGCTPPLLARAFRCVCVRLGAELVPCHSWLGCVVWVCVLGLELRLRPTTPGWGVDGCDCLWARPACTPPILAELCGVGVCDWARDLAAPRYSWLGCWWVCVFVCALCVYPATPGWGVSLGVCAGARIPAAPRHSWLEFWAVCVFLCALPLYPANPGSAARYGCVCFGSDFSCAPPPLAGVLG